MGLLARLKQAIVTPADSLELERWVEATIIPQDETRYLYTMNQEMGQFVQRAVQWIKICAHMNAGVCAFAPIRLYRPTRMPGIQDAKRMKHLTSANSVGVKAATRAQKSQIEEVTDHPALDLIRYPSSIMSGHEFARLRFLSKEVCGNAWFYLVGPEGKPPQGISFLLPHFTSIIVNDTRFIDGVMYGRDTSKRIRIPQEEVAHFKALCSLVDPYYGDTWVSAVFAEADLFRFATVSETARWQNEGRPPFVVKLPDAIQKDQRRMIIEDINRQIRGIRNAGNPLVTQFSDIKMLGWTAKDMEYTAGMERIERMIWAAAGIPESVLRPNEGSLAAAAVGHPGYMRMAITPRLALDADDMTSQILSKFPDTKGWFFAYDDVVAEDRTALLAEYEMSMRSGMRTIDEVRALEGLEPLPNGLGSIPRINGTALTLNTIPYQIDESKHQCNHDDYKPSRKALAIWKKDDKGGFETAMRMSLQVWFTNVLKDCERDMAATGNITISQGRLIELNSIMTEGMIESFKAGGLSFAPDFNIEPTRVMNVLSRHRATVMEQVTNTTLTELRDELAASIAVGDSVPQTIQRLSATYPEERAAVIARTETANAYDLGNQDAMKEAGIAYKSWQLAGGPCPLCEKIVGAIIQKWGGNKVPIDQPYLNTTDMLAIGAGKLSKDLYSANGHPNCRCGSASIREGVQP